MHMFNHCPASQAKNVSYPGKRKGYTQGKDGRQRNWVRGRNFGAHEHRKTQHVTNSPSGSPAGTWGLEQKWPESLDSEARYTLAWTYLHLFFCGVL